MPREPVTITDVAREAGVSIATVSQALSGNRPVSPGTAQRVREVVARLGYVPVSSARNLRAGRTGVIGLVIPDISNTFFGRLARGVEDAAHEAGQWVLLCHTEFEPEREDRYLDLLASRSIDGLLLIDRLDHHEVEDVVLPVELVVRNSTAAVSTGRDPHVESRSRR